MTDIGASPLSTKRVSARSSMSIRCRSATSKKSNRQWSESEVSLLKSEAHRGIVRLMRMLPHRTKGAIRQQCAKHRIPIKRIMRDIADYRWRGRLPVNEKAHPLVREMVRHMNKQKTLTREVAERSGVRPETIVGWRYRKVPNLVNLIAALNTLDLDLQIVHRG